MRYIKILNGVYELNYSSEFEYYVVVPRGVDITRGEFIIKESDIGNYETSDNIKELCDGIIMTYTEFRTEYYVYEKLDDIPLLDLKCKNKYFNIYGFVATDKGLIYVAKLNNKGELEII